jgi:transposase-like protein
MHDIWMAETKDEAEKTFDNALECYGAKYPKAMECLRKDREELLAFYDFPAEHWCISERQTRLNQLLLL